MRRYESVWVVNGDLPDEEVKAAIDKFSRIISATEGILVGLEEWGRKKLSYKIQGATRGFYILVDYAGTPATVKELERNYRIDDRIVRSLTTKKSDKVDPEALQAEIAAKAAAVAAVAAAAVPVVEPVALVAEEVVVAVEDPAAAAPVEEAAPQGREE
jgi:small subunit ribosomal protein S6